MFLVSFARRPQNNVVANQGFVERGMPVKEEMHLVFVVLPKIIKIRPLGGAYVIDVAIRYGLEKDIINLMT